MKLLCLVLIVFGVSIAQIPDGPAIVPLSNPADPDVKLPNGKSQREEILKADYKKNLADAEELARLAGELKADIEKGEGQVVSVKTLKKTDDIEKLAKSIRGRLKSD